MMEAPARYTSYWVKLNRDISVQTISLTTHRPNR